MMKNKNLILALLLAFAMPVFAQDANLSYIPYRKGDLWGYTDAYKNIIVQPEYDEANLFSEGFASVKKGKFYGYISTDGKVAIPFKFYVAKPFTKGYFSVPGNAKKGEGASNAQKIVLFAGASLTPDGYEVCIDTKGVRMPKCPAIIDNNAPDEKLATVTVTSDYSSIPKSSLFDKIVGDYKMPGATESYYIAIRNNNYGVFNKVFEVIVPFEYSLIEKLNIGPMVYLQVEKAGMKGILFGNGSPYMAVDNSKLQYILAKDGNSYFIFTKEGKTGVKSTKYKNIAEPVYADVVYDAAGGFILTGTDNLKGFCFLNQNILEPIYADVKTVKGGDYVFVKTQSTKSAQPGKILTPGKWGYINKDLVLFFED